MRRCAKATLATEALSGRQPQFWLKSKGPAPKCHDKKLVNSESDKFLACPKDTAATLRSRVCGRCRDGEFTWGSTLPMTTRAIFPVHAVNRVGQLFQLAQLVALTASQRGLAKLFLHLVENASINYAVASTHTTEGYTKWINVGRINGRSLSTLTHRQS